MSSAAPLLHELISHSLSFLAPNESNPDLQNELLRGATTLVAEAAAKSTTHDDELAVADAISRTLQRQGDGDGAKRFQQFHELLTKQQPQPHVRWAVLATMQRLMTSQDPDDALDDAMAAFNKGVLDDVGDVTVRMAPAPVLGAVPLAARATPSGIDIAEVHEATLVRDCVFAAQGLEGNFVRFSAEADNAGEVLCELQGGTVESQVVCKLAELGWLVRRVESLTDVTATTNQHSQGRVRQAFCSAARQELHAFFKLMAYLESFLQLPMPQPGQPATTKTSASYLTLRRLLPWLRPSLQRLRLLCAMAEAATLLKGGALITAIHGFAQHGDPSVAQFVSAILAQAQRPLLDMIRVWLAEGRLEDPCQEFFIAPEEQGAAARLSAEAAAALQLRAQPDAWLQGYRLTPAMRPPFVSEELAAIIFKAGKCIHFLRECCDDREWTLSREGGGAGDWAAPLLQGQVGQCEVGEVAALHHRAQTAELDRVAREAYARINRHLMDVLLNKRQFEKHCTAIKRYLLLGQGDFIQALMDAVGGDLGKRAGDISEYSLNASLDAATRASNAQYDDPDVMDRLRIRLDKATGVETVEATTLPGWDVFVLHYEMDQPLSSIIHRDAANGYLRVFRLLWGMRRVEHSLNGAWKQMTLTERTLGQLRTTARRNGLGVPGLDGVWGELRHAHRVLSEMAHFATNMQTYLHFEVMEASWEDFCRDSRSVRDLDSLVAAHDAYVGGILRKALLGDGTLGKSAEGRTDVQRELQAALRSILDLAGPVKRLHELVEAAFMEVREHARCFEESYAKGQWNSKAARKLKGVTGEQLSEIQSVTRNISAAYSRHQALFVQLMANQAHVDTHSFIYRMTKESGHPSIPHVASRA